MLALLVVLVNFLVSGEKLYEKNLDQLAEDWIVKLKTKTDEGMFELANNNFPQFETLLLETAAPYYLDFRSRKSSSEEKEA